MKRNLLSGTIAVCGALAVLPSCDESMFMSDSSNGAGGHIIPTVTVDSKVTSAQKNIESKSPESRAEAAGVSVDDLVLALVGSDGATVFTCTGVDNFPIDKDFKVGDYTFEASYGDPKDEGFDKPAYYGATPIKVEENKTTSVSLQATLANSMVGIEFGENLLDYATNVSAALSTTGDDIVFSDTETRPAYIYPGMTSVKVTLTKPNGTSGTLTAATFTAKAAYLHNVKIDIKDGAGDAVLEITFDSTVEEEDVEIDLSDDILNAPAPELTLKGFESGEPVSFIPGLSSTAEMSVDIVAKATVRSLLMTTSGPLLQKGWPESIDLVKASESQQQLLKSLGLEVLGIYRNPDKMAIVDFTGVPANIDYNDNGTGTTEITLTVIDGASKSSEPVTLVLESQALQLDLEAVSEVYPGEGEDMQFTLVYNGDKPADELSFQVNNARGTWSDTGVKSIEAVEGSENAYKVVIVAPATEEDVKVRALCTQLSKYSNEVVVKKVPFKLQLDENDVFATHATLATIVTDEALDAGTVARTGFSLSPNEGSISYNEGVITLTGLTPGKTYQAVIEYDGLKCRTVEFTTEEALTTVNSGFDTWTYDADKMGDYQTWWYPDGQGSVWDTMNGYTMQARGSGSSILGYGGTAYRATSGTKPANGNTGGTKRTPSANASSGYQNSGENAALIRTVGWGSGNTSFGNSGKCENIEPGQLYLGYFDEQLMEPVKGIEFGSRPSALEFYYRYEPVKAGNGDRGYVNIVLRDEDRNVVFETTTVLDEQWDTYRKVTVNFDYKPYPQSNNKAKYLEVTFCSCYEPETYAARSYVNNAGTANYTDAEYDGSKLYIDDVQLIY